MRLLSRLSIAVGGLLLAALAGGSLAIWSAWQAEWSLKRTNFSHSSYEAHLGLSAHVYQLWGRLVSSAVVATGTEPTEQREHVRLLRLIRADIAMIRSLIGQEIALVGEEEVIELAHLEKLETMIEDLLLAMRVAENNTDDPDYRELLINRAGALQTTIDRDFRPLIHAAIVEEADEVRRATDDVTQRLQFQRVAVVVFMVLVSLIAVVALRRLRRDIAGPVRELAQGAAAIAGGRTSHRIKVAGPPELNGVAAAFNLMAERVSAREESLAETNQRLEQAVAERTVELRRLLDALRESDRWRQRMLADVSHELRTPLTIIRGESDIALRGAAKSVQEYRGALERCRSAATHTARLVDDLLIAARRDGGGITLARAELDLVELIESTITDSRSLFDERASIRFETETDVATVFADAGRIRQVLIILLDNAARYGGDCTYVRLQHSDGQIVLLVEDNGTGMPEEEIGSAFDRFFRGNNAAGRYDRGTGLGLPVARSIINAHGGSIMLTNRKPAGLVARVELPAGVAEEKNV